MPSRYYSATAQDTTLNGNITSGATTIVTSSSVGFPSNYPYVLAIDFNASQEELVLVTASTGLNTYTVTRGYNSTQTVAHKTGAVIRHVISAQDMTDMQAHFDATSNVHGVTDNLAGFGDVTNIAFLTMGA
jgi:hypothetical protein